MANEDDTSSQVTNQLFARPEALYITGGIIFALGVIPGMPNLIFLLLGSAWSAAAG